MILEDSERRRFAEWLEENAATAKILVEQTEKLVLTGFSAIQLIKILRFEAAASEFLAQKLRNTELQTISDGKNT